MSRTRSRRRNTEKLRRYGSAPFRVALLHGGPGAPGEMAPVARELSSTAGILEPFQSEASIDGQVAELHSILADNAEFPVTLAGFSWGATLAFIFAARYPELVGKLVLIGSPPFTAEYAAGITPTRLNRMSEEQRREFLELAYAMDAPEALDRNDLMYRVGLLLCTVDAYEPDVFEHEAAEFSYEVNSKVWAEAEKLRSSGELLALAPKIKCRVIAIHGDYDPHPAEGVREPLSKALKSFDFVLLEKCGHEPWIEKYARDKFYEVMRATIASPAA